MYALKFLIILLFVIEINFIEFKNVGNGFRIFPLSAYPIIIISILSCIRYPDKEEL